ncbi:phage tail tube protein [Sporanaerobacter acetigenes]|uniref:Phage tail tube protein, TTP n=1 Tax=Sporanaerobacter acetigenes DSM 13106 TaxID=1123281 RepID=A0A1M5TZG0_9FIRM|nr:phage tail tube protein [Sporanaerobacter acetigenes]SHH56006.1 Phage tail tube protein, TTP [Sporanaerobacter acetigenes DSM 13106]
MAGTSFNETKISYKEGTMTDYKEIDLLMEIPEIGGDPEKIDVTTLSDKHKKYIPGISDLGDLNFVFLHDNSSATSNYRVLKKMQDENKIASYKVEYPDGSGHEFDAYVSVKIAGGGVNTAKTFTASMFLQSEIKDINPTGV